MSVNPELPRPVPTATTVTSLAELSAQCVAMAAHDPQFMSKKHQYTGTDSQWVDDSDLWWVASVGSSHAWDNVSYIGVLSQIKLSVGRNLPFMTDEAAQALQDKKIAPPLEHFAGSFVAYHAKYTVGPHGTFGVETKRLYILGFEPEALMHRTPTMVEAEDGSGKINLEVMLESADNIAVPDSTQDDSEQAMFARLEFESRLQVAHKILDMTTSRKQHLLDVVTLFPPEVVVMLDNLPSTSDGDSE